MKFSEAFKALGYTVMVPRQDWSAERPQGVCISLWQSELRFRNGRAQIDTREDCLDNNLWRGKPGNQKRIRHLQRALSEFGGYVDVVLVAGKPGAGVTDATPWDSGRRGARWRVLSLDEPTGHFTAETAPLTP